MMRIDNSSTDAEIRQAYDEIVGQWREILPIGGQARHDFVQQHGLNPVLVSELYPVTAEEVYERIVTCLVSESVPDHLRDTMFHALSAEQQFARLVRKLPTDLRGVALLSAMSQLELSRALYWVADDLEMDEITIQFAKDNLVALSYLLSATMASPMMDSWDLRKLIELLRENLTFAFTLTGFVQVATPYLDKPVLRQRATPAFTIGVPKVLKGKNGNTAVIQVGADGTLPEGVV